MNLESGFQQKGVQFLGRLVFLFFLPLVLLSCATAQAPIAKNETPKEVKRAVKSVAEAMSGKELSDAEVNKLVNDLKTDEEAQSAVKAMTDAVSGEKPKLKYSPVTGKRYAPHMEYDPETGAKLEWVK